MAKSTKRSRKFVAKGGVKKMLARGQTFTKKGRVLNRRAQREAEAEGHAERRVAAEGRARKEEQERERAEGAKRDEEDFAGEAQARAQSAALGGMDMDDFFRSVVDDDGGGGGSDDEYEDFDSGSDNKEEEEEEEERSDSESDSDDGEDDDSGDEAEAEAADSDDSDDDNGSGSGSDDDDDDVEAAERRMRREMAQISKNDPEFHKYLRENEGSLLEFGDEGAEDDAGDDSADDRDEAMEEAGDRDDEAEEEEEDDDEDARRKNDVNSDDESDDDGGKDNRPVLTPSLLRAMERSAFASRSGRGLRKIVSAYRSACHLSEEASGDADPAVLRRGYRIDDSVAYDRLMVSVLRGCQGEFRYHLLGVGAGRAEDGKGNGRKRRMDGKKEEEETEENEEAVDENKPISPKVLARSKRWRDLGPVLQSFLRSTLHVLSEAKEPDLLTFVLKELAHYVPYLSAFPKAAKAALKSLISLWSAPLDSSEDYQTVRLHAFLRIRQLALTQPFSFIEDCLKSCYLSYAKRAKFGTAASVHSVLPTLTFMGNCIVELYSLDYTSSYQHAFVYIRQLALHLRNALQKRTAEALRAVYCWQYVHCLRLWSAVLSAACSSSRAEGDDEARLMRSLVYPLTEVIFGTARLVPTARHLPLRLHCVRMLQKLAASAEMFIPTTSILLEALDLKELYIKPRKVGAGKSDVDAVRLPVVLKLPKETALRTAEQLDACLSELFVLLNREADLFRFSPAFPEFSARVVQRLRKFSKDAKNGKHRAYSRGCVDACERFAAEAKAARSDLQEAPRDVRRLEALRPPGRPSMGERHEATIAKERRLEEASRPAARERAGGGEEERGKKKKGASKKKTKETGGEEGESEQDARKTDSASKTKRSRKNKRRIDTNEADLRNVSALEEEDEVQEGIEWSESDDDGSGGMDESD